MEARIETGEIFKRLSLRDSEIVSTPVSFEEINVKYSLDSIFVAYNEDLMCKIESDERGHRLNSMVKLTSEESAEYMRYILVQRIKYLQNERVNVNLLKQLMVPFFFYSALESIGIYDDPESGLTFNPETEEKVTINEDKVLEIGNKFAKLKDCYWPARGAFIKSKEGDPDVMRMACVHNQVVSVTGTSSPTREYFAAFLNAKIAEDIEKRGLYRMQYDAISTILHHMQSDGMAVC